MDAREIESLSMLSRGFFELKEANAELAYNVILDVLCGINECVNLYHCICDEKLIFDTRNPAIRHHVQTSRNLFPHKRIIRKSEMTAKGLVVTEVQEEISGLPSSSDSDCSAPAASSTSAKIDDPTTTSRKSPIAELLYMRWLEGLKIKWPNLM
jgi:serine/threonine-protein kinase 24/25/MST4